MIKLSNYIKKFISQDLMGRRVIYSSHEEPGEGEHCILQYIYNMKNADKQQHIIYGLDADLIMLSLATKLKEIYLLREVQHFEGKSSIQNNDLFHYLSLSKLRESFKIEAEKEYEIKIKKIENVVDDFLFLCFFLGNDFLPHLKAIDIYNDGINLLLKEYYNILKSTNQNENDYLLSPGKNKIINMQFLKKLLNILSQNEDKYIKDNISKERRRSKFDPIKYLNNNWEYRYYNYFFKTNTPDFIKKVCENYWKTIVWTMEYYFNKCPSWSHYYYYANSPTLNDMTRYINYNDLNKIKFKETKPNTAYEQLMMILPPNSSQLLPKKLSNLMKNELCEYYPTDFVLDTVDKKVNWMYEPKLPYIDEKQIYKYVNM